MPIAKILRLGVLASILLVSPALARVATDSETNMLKTTVDNYTKALKQRNMEAILDAFPPQIFAQLAQQANVDETQMRQLIIKQLKQVSSTVTIDEVSFDLDNKKAGELKNGEPYFIVPMSLIITTQNRNRTSINSDLVALFDKGQWHLVRGDNSAFIDTLEKIFPGFNDIQLSKAKIESI